jgi:hypothetical protein
MSQSAKELLKEVKSILDKKGFVPSPQMQEQVAAAQQAGAIPPPDPAQQQAQPSPEIQQLAGMMQEGFNAVLGAMEQLAQLIQQSAAPAGAQGGQQKKPSTTERLEIIEQTLAQLSQGGAPAGAPPEDMAAAQAQPPQQPAA